MRGRGEGLFIYLCVDRRRVIYPKVRRLTSGVNQRSAAPPVMTKHSFPKVTFNSFTNFEKIDPVITWSRSMSSIMNWNFSMKFSQSVSRDLLHVYYMPDKILGAGDTVWTRQTGPFPKVNLHSSGMSLLSQRIAKNITSLCQTPLCFQQPPFLWTQNWPDGGEFWLFRLLFSSRCPLSCLHTCYTHCLWGLQRW